MKKLSYCYCLFDIYVLENIVVTCISSLPYPVWHYSNYLMWYVIHHLQIAWYESSQVPYSSLSLTLKHFDSSKSTITYTPQVLMSMTCFKEKLPTSLDKEIVTICGQSFPLLYVNQTVIALPLKPRLPSPIMSLLSMVLVVFQQNFHTLPLYIAFTTFFLVVYLCCNIFSLLLLNKCLLKWNFSPTC